MSAGRPFPLPAMCQARKRSPRHRPEGCKNWIGEELPEDVSADGSGVAVTELDMSRLDRSESSELIRGLVQAGHGFTVETPDLPEEHERRECAFCGAPLSQKADDWLCQFEPGPWARRSPERERCRCNWCLCRRQVEQGRYLARGRPRAQCGSQTCARQAKNKQQRERRARQKAQALAA
jgi:hypothetical protein